MVSYGLPHKGSKNRLVKKITELFPEADNFYDLFAGGAAVSHYLLTTNKFKNIYINDIDENTVQFLKNAFNGVYENRNEWISKEEFDVLKYTDPFVASCWSFGNNRKSYMYSKLNEPYKRAAHYAIVFDGWEEMYELYSLEIVEILKQAVKDLNAIRERRLAFGSVAKKLKLKNIEEAEALNRIERITNLSSLERVNNLNNLNGLNGIKFSCSDYREIKIKENSVIYTDIPYKGTSGYGFAFDYEAFYDWGKNQTQPVFISSYEMPSDFKIIAEFEFRSLMGPNKKVIERIFTI